MNELSYALHCIICQVPISVRKRIAREPAKLSEVHSNKKAKPIKMHIILGLALPTYVMGFSLDYETGDISFTSLYIL